MLFNSILHINDQHIFNRVQKQFLIGIKSYLINDLQAINHFCIKSFINVRISVKKKKENIIY